MRRITLLTVLVVLFIGGYAFGQAQGWQADQDGMQFKLYDVQSVNVNGGLSNVDSCLISPDSILFTPVLSSTDATITRAAQNGTGALKIINGNQAGLIDLGVEQTLLRMTAQGLDNGGVNIAGATYFGVRSDTTAAYPGDRDYQQVYFAPQSIYEVSGHVVTPPLNGTTMLSPYYFRGETVGLDGTAGNNTRPDGISLGFFWDQPSLTVLHGFTANSYQTGEIFGPPCSGATCYGLRIYGGSSDNSLRVAGTLVADGLGGSGTRCVQVDNTGTMAIASSACGTGSGTVTSVNGTPGRIDVTPSSPNPVVDLATFGTASTCAWANVVTDAYGRTTCTANTAPQPAGNYITALTHDVTATGPGSVAAEVTGITDGTSVDHQVAAGAWTNSQALALDGSGSIHTAAFQAPLTACTDYVSVSCQGGTSDIGTGGSNSAVQVTAIHEAFGPSRIPFGNINASGQALIYDGSVIAGYPPAGDLSGSYVTGPKTACKVNWYTQQTNMVASAWVPISDMTNLTTNQAELPCDHKATTGTLYVNIVANGLTGGSVLIYITRNGGGFGATLTVTSGTATGVHSVGASTGSGSANDTYGLFFDGITGSATGTLLVFSAEAVLN